VSTCDFEYPPTVPRMGRGARVGSGLPGIPAELMRHFQL